MELAYEAAQAADADLIFDLSRQLIEQYEDIRAIDLERVLLWVRRKITDHIDSYTRILYRGQLAGFYRFISNGEEMELDDFYVLPPFRGMGIGSQVLGRCCQTNAPIMLYVFTDNRRAIALYRRFGFRIAEEVGTTRAIMRRPAGAQQEVL